MCTQFSIYYAFPKCKYISSSIKYKNVKARVHLRNKYIELSLSQKSEHTQEYTCISQALDAFTCMYLQHATLVLEH